MLDEDIDAEVDEVIGGLSTTIESHPGSPFAALADGILLLNHRIWMIHENVLKISRMIDDVGAQISQIEVGERSDGS